MTNLNQLDTFDPDSGQLNVIIDTPKGSRNKYKYDEQRHLFQLHGVLPLGSFFPFDFGYLPSTRGEDGDPLDVLVLMDEPAFVGCLVPARLLGVIEAEQTEKGETVRNDRLIAVAAHAHTWGSVQSLSELNKEVLQEIEHFFVSYNVARGKQFQPLGQHGIQRAHKLIERGQKMFAEKK